MSRIERGHFAVFARNHRVHLDEAVAVCVVDPSRQVTFRASTTWASAERAVVGGPPVPIYIAAVGGPGTIEYVAELCDLQTQSHRGDPKTERLLKLWTNSTKDEGLWEKYDKRVRTLYISRLVKAADGKPLSAGFKYSYALVVPAPDSAV